MKQLEVQIMGQSYLLGCPEGGESSLREAVKRVDGAMCKIRDAGKVKARDRIAVLAALNLAFEIQAQTATPDPKQENQTEAEALAGAMTSAQNLPHAPLDDHESTRLLALLASMDHALGKDGQLF